MDRIVEGDVQQDAHNDGDVPAVARGLTVSQYEAASRSQAGEPRPGKPSTDLVVVGDIPRQPSGWQPRPHLMGSLNWDSW